MRRWLRGGTVVTLDADDRVFDPGAVVFEDERLVYVGTADGYAATGSEEVLDVKDQLVLPGLVNAHSHAFQRVIRGRTELRSAASTLPRRSSA